MTEQNYFVLNGTVKKVLDLQTKRDKITVAYPSDEEALFKGFNHIDIDDIKDAGISKFSFTFGGTTTEFVATLAQAPDPNPTTELQVINKGSINIKKFSGELTEKVVAAWKTAANVLKIVAYSDHYQVFFLKQPLLKLKEKTPTHFYRAGKSKRHTK